MYSFQVCYLLTGGKYKVNLSIKFISFLAIVLRKYKNTSAGVKTDSKAK